MAVRVGRLAGAIALTMRALLAVAAGLLSLAASTPALAGPDCFAPDKALVTGLEDGLLPAVVAKGVPTHRTSLEERLRDLKVPAVSIAYIHDGRIAWARAFGAAGLDGRCATPDSLFQAGSLSKPVAALAILHLAQAGDIDLDVGVNRYLKSWRVPANPYSGPDGPTLRQILSHTAGFTVHGFGGYAAGAPVPTTVQVLDGAKPANSAAIVVDTHPGTVWRYSGGGYVVAQQLVEDVTGKPFTDFMRDTVLAPVGMTHSTYRQPIPPELAAKVAMPVDDKGRPIVGGPHIYPEEAPAGLWTTPSDLARYAIAVQDALSGRSSKVISQPTAREMLEPVRGVTGLNWGPWGLGLSLGGSAEHPYFAHGGTDAGYHAQLTAYDQGDGVVIMTNGDNGWKLIDPIVRTLAYENGWPDFRPVERAAARIEASALDAYPGKFRIGRYSILTVERSGDRLASRYPGEIARELLPSNASEWFYVDDADDKVTFQFDDQRRVSGLVLHRWGFDNPAARLSEADARRIASELAAKVRNQVQTPGSEAALRRMLEELRAGTPRYELMSPNAAQIVRTYLTQYKSILAEEGELKSLAFNRVSPDGADIYKATFAKGVTFFWIILGEDGRIDDTAVSHE
jgi:CubicO group peptidase (beta-lactamase class C family)